MVNKSDFFSIKTKLFGCKNFFWIINKGFDRK